jgi:hypothetical protein
LANRKNPTNPKSTATAQLILNNNDESSLWWVGAIFGLTPIFIRIVAVLFQPDIEKVPTEFWYSSCEMIVFCFVLSCTTFLEVLVNKKYYSSNKTTGIYVGMVVWCVILGIIFFAACISTISMHITSQQSRKVTFPIVFILILGTGMICRFVTGNKLKKS